MVAFLHTLEANVAKFEALVKNYAPELHVQHFVNEVLLQSALADGEIDYEGFCAEVEKIKEYSPERIICTCSTYGEAADRRGDVERIDRPVVEYIVKKYKKVGLAYAATSTLGASRRLLLNSAQDLKREIEIIPIDCTAAWPSYQSGEMSTYALSIASAVKAKASSVEAVFLAQASMEGALEFLTGLGVEVLTSPDFGVAFYLRGR